MDRFYFESHNDAMLRFPNATTRKSKFLGRATTTLHMPPALGIDSGPQQLQARTQAIDSLKRPLLWTVWHSSFFVVVVVVHGNILNKQMQKKQIWITEHYWK